MIWVERFVPLARLRLVLFARKNKIRYFSEFAYCKMKRIWYMVQMNFFFRVSSLFWISKKEISFD